VGNLRKKRYHLATCEDVRAMSDANVYLLKDRQEALEKGLKPCEHCQPDAHPPPSADD
jgi:methylphosphotriester-DNA--protein-cysteine methyltransferase